MKTSVPEEVLTKIKKLLALATSDNVNEATLAMSKAQDLMNAYQIEISELEASGEEDFEKPEHFDDPIFTEHNPRDWKVKVLMNFAYHNGCFLYLNKVYRGKTYRLIGRPSDVSYVKYMATYAILEFTKISKIECNYRDQQYKISWFEGAVAGLIAQLREKAEARKTQMSSTALVKYDNRLNEAKKMFNDMFGGGKSAPFKQRNHNHKAYNDGFNTGKNLNLNNEKGKLPGSRNTLSC